MSSTKRGATRHEADFYSTPEAAFKPLLPFLSCHVKLWEPAWGDGRLVRWMVEAHLDAAGDDLKDGYDFLKDESQRGCIITNPPFSLALEFCNHAISHAPHVFMLLRLNFLASASRRDWWRAHPPSALFILSERPSFAMFIKCHHCGQKFSLPSESERPKQCDKCGGKLAITTSDSTDYAWFYWGGAHNGLHFL